MEGNLNSQLIDLLSPLVNPLGYEIVHLEVQNHRHKVLRLFIDRLEAGEGGREAGIGIEDCVRVTKALDEPLDGMAEVDQAFGGAPYELEVSSPGIDRPLRTPRDFAKFAGREARIYVLRPLSAEELADSDYQAKNPKQKNFLGTLRGFRGESAQGSVLLEPNLTGGHDKDQARKKAKGSKNSVEGSAPKAVKIIEIPLPLISKANLEADLSDPEFSPQKKESR